jgi:hypothetical protein
MLLLNSVVSFLINCLALPAVFLSLRLVVDSSMGRKSLQQTSFLLIALAYVILFLFFPGLRQSKATTAVVFLFGLLFFCLNFGAGLTTYILPQVLQSTC